MDNIFEYGTSWFRADFHLHTNADKEFKYNGNENFYHKEYIDALVRAGIRLGIITNHNKFDFDEFRKLRKLSRQSNIALLPGVELSVNDGRNGIHTLIVFSDLWLENNNDYISPFIDSMFPGAHQGQHKSGRSSGNILQVVTELEKINRDYFLVFAHVEQKNGLWEEMGGGKLEEFTGKTYENVRRRTLGFQKVRTCNKQEQVKKWLKDWYPAEIEGSDCKSVEDIGSGEKCYLKIGDLSFEAVKFALQDKENRVSTTKPPEYKHSHIRSIRFTGGTFNNQELRFSPELNTLIGIRGSGKSSILEILRHALEIQPGEKAGDRDYKQKLVSFTLRGGGKVEIDAVDRYGQHYTIRRIGREESSEILIDGKLNNNISIQETVLYKPIYFGQKDLSNTGQGFEKDLVEKLLGPGLVEVRRKISLQKETIVEVINRLLKITNIKEQIEEQQQIRQNTEHQLEFYRKHGIEEKLQKQLEFEKDVRRMNKGINFANNFVSDLENLLAGHEDDLRNFSGYQSKHNKELFGQFHQQYEFYISFIDYLKEWLNREKTKKQSLIDSQNQLNQICQKMTEEFASIQRELTEELKSSSSPNISTDEFLNLKNKLADANILISELQKPINQLSSLKEELLSKLQTLKELWREEFNLIRTELDKTGSNNSPISITYDYQKDNTAFLEFMKDIFRGSGIHTTTFEKIVEKYDDFIAIYKDLENARKFFGSNPHVLAKHFRTETLKTLPHLPETEQVYSHV